MDANRDNQSKPRLAKNTRLLCSIVAACILLLIGFGFGVSLFTSWRVSERQRINQLNDGEKYALDLANLLGSNWSNEGKTVVLDQEDYAQWNTSVAGRVEWTARSDQNSFGYYKYGVVTYTDSDNALNGYETQNRWLFERSFGVSLPHEQFPYRAIGLNNILLADKYAGGCKDILSADTRCSALLLLNNHVVFVDSFIKKDGEQLMSRENFIELLKITDAKLHS